MITIEVPVWHSDMTTLVEHVNNTDQAPWLIDIGWSEEELIGLYTFTSNSVSFTRSVIPVIETDATSVMINVQLREPAVTVTYGKLRIKVNVDIKDKGVTEALSNIRWGCDVALLAEIAKYKAMDINKLAEVTAGMAGISIHTRDELLAFIRRINKNREEPHRVYEFLELVERNMTECLPKRKMSNNKHNRLITIDFTPEPLGV